MAEKGVLRFTGARSTGDWSHTGRGMGPPRHFSLAACLLQSVHRRAALRSDGLAARRTGVRRVSPAAFFKHPARCSSLGLDVADH